MPIATFNRGYPPDGYSLGNTKVVIRNNLDGTFDTLAVDHVNNNGIPGSNPPGYHTLIHQITQTNVKTLADYNQVFSGIPGVLEVNSVVTPAIPPGGDTQLYNLTASGVLTQLTGGLFDAVNGNGYASISGLLIQWGRITGLSGSWPTSPQTLNFVTENVNFPTESFIVLTTFIGPSSSSTGDISIN